jgi:hypothetical protein
MMQRAPWLAGLDSCRAGWVAALCDPRATKCACGSLKWVTRLAPNALHAFMRPGPCQSRPGRVH